MYHYQEITAREVIHRVMEIPPAIQSKYRSPFGDDVVSVWLNYTARERGLKLISLNVIRNDGIQSFQIVWES